MASPTAAPQPNYVNPVTHGPSLIIVSSLSLGLMILFLLARLWARFVILRRPGTDDYLIILAFILRIANYVSDYFLVEHWYWNRHTIDVPPDSISQVIKRIWIGTFYAYGSLMFIKTSILFFFFGVLRKAQYNTTKWVVVSSIVFTFGYSIVIFFWYAFNCSPPEAAWLLYDKDWPKTHKFTCGDVSKTPMFSVVLNCITDFWITLLPLAFISRLNLPRRQKQALCFVFGLGFIVCGASAYRAYSMHVLLYNRHADVFWEGYYNILAGEVEGNVAIICACAPTLKAFSTRFGQGSDASKPQPDTERLGRRGITRKVGSWMVKSRGSSSPSKAGDGPIEHSISEFSEAKLPRHDERPSPGSDGSITDEKASANFTSPV